MELVFEHECKILYELAKYSYHQIGDEQLKSVIYDFMSDHGEIDFLLDVVHNFDYIPYSTLLHKGYEYERFFSTDSLIFVYGDNLPKRIRDKTYFPEYFTDDKILLNSTDKAFEYFKVIFHKNLREISDTKEKYKMNMVRFRRSSSYDTLYDLLEIIEQNTECVFVSNNISWVTKILRKERFTLYHRPQTTSLCSCNMLIAVNSIFILIAMTTV
jgi:hypothetical protein